MAPTFVPFIFFFGGGGEGVHKKIKCTVSRPLPKIYIA
jgi:hypothetical protein